MRRAPALLAIAALLGAIPAAAQSNLSTQGFGYPTGQISARALGTGGAIAEIDPVSATNPAALASLGGKSLYFQIEPEFRRVTFGSTTTNTTTARYPLAAAAMTFGSRWTVGLGVSTLLDRTWETTQKVTQVVGPDVVDATQTYRSEGAMNDVRLAVAWAPRPWLRAGLGGHAISGSNRLSMAIFFDDSSRFNPLGVNNTISYGGNALSAGVDLRAGTLFALGASVRGGGQITAQSGDSTLSRADVPLKYGVTLAYVGLRNSTFAVRASRDNWSSLQSLGNNVEAVDAWDVGVGGDVAGPRFAGRLLMIRAGARWRTLPFAAPQYNAPPMPTRPGFSPVKERSLTGGLGTVVAGGRATLELTGARVTREADVGASEKAWLLSAGISVRP